MDAAERFMELENKWNEDVCAEAVKIIESNGLPPDEAVRCAADIVKGEWKAAAVARCRAYEVTDYRGRALPPCNHALYFIEAVRCEKHRGWCGTCSHCGESVHKSDSNAARGLDRWEASTLHSTPPAKEPHQ